MHVNMELNEKWKRGWGERSNGRLLLGGKGWKDTYQNINSEKLLLAKDGEFATSITIKPTTLKYISYVYIYDLVILKITATNWSLLEDHIFW